MIPTLDLLVFVMLWMKGLYKVLTLFDLVAFACVFCAVVGTLWGMEE